jgi:2-dehydro-3-deoxygalactonokinase
MVGSRHGWREAPYLACPASLHDLARQLVPAPDEPEVFIVPGLKMTGARADVMRGEELQVLGLGAADADHELICIPGTHAKWIVAERGIVRKFHTAMTGELYAAVTEHTLLAPLLPPALSVSPPRAAAFDTGLQRSAAAHGLLHALFELRAGTLLGSVAPEDLRDVISGLLIGTEVRHVQALFAGRQTVALLGAPAVSERYSRALGTFGFKTTPLDVSEISARGFVAVAQAAGFATAAASNDGKPQ